MIVADDDTEPSSDVDPGDLPPAAARAFDIGDIHDLANWSTRPERHSVAYCSATLDAVVDGHHVQSLTLRVERRDADHYPGTYWDVTVLAYIDDETRRLATDHHHNVTDAGRAVYGFANDERATIRNLLADGALDE